MRARWPDSPWNVGGPDSLWQALHPVREDDIRHVALIRDELLTLEYRLDPIRELRELLGWARAGPSP